MKIPHLIISALLLSFFLSVFSGSQSSALDGFCDLSEADGYRPNQNPNFTVLELTCNQMTAEEPLKFTLTDAAYEMTLDEYSVFNTNPFVQAVSESYVKSGPNEVPRTNAYIDFIYTVCSTVDTNDCFETAPFSVGPPEDSDGDGYSDVEETSAGSDPANGDDTPLDTDGDGFRDFVEDEAGTDKNDANSYPGVPPVGPVYTEPRFGTKLGIVLLIVLMGLVGYSLVKFYAPKGRR